jgi:hypothetical protein
MWAVGDKPRAIVSDIDDSLDIFGGQPNMRVVMFIRSAYAQGRKVIILTNRSALRQAQTVRWLAYWRVPFHKLIMRPLGSVKTYWAWKAFAYREQIEPYYDVELAIDNLRQPWDFLKVRLWLINVGSDNAKIARQFQRAGGVMPT